VLQQDDIYDQSDRDDHENKANREHDLSDSLGHILSNGLGNNPSECEPTTQFVIEAMRMMVEKQRGNHLHTVDRDKFKY